MPMKVYSHEQKEQIRMQLLETALQLYSQYGVRNIKLMDILKVVGISKPFFYTFYNSVPEFIIYVLEYQWGKFPSFLEGIEKNIHLSWEEKIYQVLKALIYYYKNGFLILTQKEEVWLYQRLNCEYSHALMDRQIIFFEDLLKRWGIPKGKCDPKVLSNMVVSMVVIHNSSKESLPFMFHDELDETAKACAKSIIAYLKLLKDDNGGNE